MKLTVEERVRMLLSLIPYYEERQYIGNYYDNDDLNDIKYAIERADLTDKQRQAIDLVFIKDLTQREVAKTMGVGLSTVNEHVSRAVTLVAQAYEKGKLYDTE